MPLLDGYPERRLAVFVCRAPIDIPSLQQYLHHSFMSLAGGYEEWCFAVFISSVGIDIGPLEQ